jgi:hypothetical protein
MLASKYRFLFLEDQSRYSPMVLSSTTGKALVKELRHLLKDLDRIRASVPRADSRTFRSRVASPNLPAIAIEDSVIPLGHA